MKKSYKEQRSTLSKKINGESDPAKREKLIDAVVALNKAEKKRKADSKQASTSGRAYAEAAVDPSSRGARAKTKTAQVQRTGGKTTVYGETVSGYLLSQKNPEEGRGFLSPFSHNNEPSIRVTPATTTAVFDIDVAVNSTSQLSFFPGHASASDINAMDPVSFHSQALNIPAVAGNRIPGPIGVLLSGSVLQPSCIHLKQGLANGYATEDSTGGTYYGWDSNLPYTGVTLSGHSRWQLVSMSVRIVNNTIIGSRGGSIVTVQKTNNNLILGSGGVPLTQGAGFGQFPSYKAWGNRDIRLVKSLRSEDVAMWHVPNADLAATGDQTLRAASMKLWMNNHSAQVQSYTVTCVFNWQLAGDLFGTVATPIFVQPSSLLDSVSSIVQNYFPSGEKTGDVYRRVMSMGYDKIAEFVMNYAKSEHDYASLKFHDAI